MFRSAFVFTTFTTILHVGNAYDCSSIITSDACKESAKYGCVYDEETRTCGMLNVGGLYDDTKCKCKADDETDTTWTCGCVYENDSLLPDDDTPATNCKPWSEYVRGRLEDYPDNYTPKLYWNPQEARDDCMALPDCTGISYYYEDENIDDPRHHRFEVRRGPQTDPDTFSNDETVPPQYWISYLYRPDDCVAPPPSMSPTNEPTDEPTRAPIEPEETPAPIAPETPAPSSLTDVCSEYDKKNDCNAVAGCDWIGTDPNDHFHTGFCRAENNLCYEKKHRHRCVHDSGCAWVGEPHDLYKCVPKSEFCGRVPDKHTCNLTFDCMWMSQKTPQCQVESHECWKYHEPHCRQDRACIWLKKEKRCVRIDNRVFGPDTQPQCVDTLQSVAVVPDQKGGYTEEMTTCYDAMAALGGDICGTMAYAPHCCASCKEVGTVPAMSQSEEQYDSVCRCKSDDRAHYTCGCVNQGNPGVNEQYCSPWTNYYNGGLVGVPEALAEPKRFWSMKDAKAECEKYEDCGGIIYYFLDDNYDDPKHHMYEIRQGPVVEWKKQDEITYFYRPDQCVPNPGDDCHAIPTKPTCNLTFDCMWLPKKNPPCQYESHECWKWSHEPHCINDRACLWLETEKLCVVKKEDRSIDLADCVDTLQDMEPPRDWDVEAYGEMTCGAAVIAYGEKLCSTAAYAPYCCETCKELMNPYEPESDSGDGSVLGGLLAGIAFLLVIIGSAIWAFATSAEDPDPDNEISTTNKFD